MGSQKGHNYDICPLSILCSLVFQILTIDFWHPATLDLKGCWVADCSLHLPYSPPSQSFSLPFALLPSSFSQFICVLEFYWINREKDELGMCTEWNYPRYWTIKAYLRYWETDTWNIVSLNRLCFWVCEKKILKKKEKKKEGILLRLIYWHHIYRYLWKGIMCLLMSVVMNVK